MPLNPSIFSNLLAQPKSPEEYAAERRQNMLSDLQYKSALQQQTDDQAYRTAIKGFGTDTGANYKALLVAGLPRQAEAYQKQQFEAQKAQQDIATGKSTAAKNNADAMAKRLDAAGQALNFVRLNPTVDNAHATLDYLGANGIYTPDQVSQYKAQVQANPGSIASLAEMAFRSALDAKDQLFKDQTRNLGGTTDTISTDPVTGVVRTINSVKNTVSPDALLREAGDERRSLRSDARQRETNAVSLSKPFEVTGPDGGPVLVQQDKGGNLRQVQGYGPKPAAPSASLQKELMSIGQQRSILNGALTAVQNTPSAFSFKRGLGGKLPFGESVAGRMETPDETQARSYVFNNVSRIINERAGAAQSAQEIARLNTFLPADTDGAEQIKNKLNGFNQYLNDLESGTKGQPKQPQRISSDAEYNALPSGATFVGPDGKTRRKP